MNNYLIATQGVGGTPLSIAVMGFTNDYGVIGVLAPLTLSAALGDPVISTSVYGLDALGNATSASGVISQVQVLVASNSTTISSISDVAITCTLDLTGDNSSTAETTSSGVITKFSSLLGANCLGIELSPGGIIERLGDIAGDTTEQWDISGTGEITVLHNLLAADSIEVTSSSSLQVILFHELTAASLIEDAYSQAGQIVLDSSIDALVIIRKLLSNRQELDPVLGKYRVYDDDGVTVLYQANAWEDAMGVIPYRGVILGRIDALV